MFFLPLFRVIDQTGTTFRRALVFAHLAPLSYSRRRCTWSSSAPHVRVCDPSLKMVFIYMAACTSR